MNFSSASLACTKATSASPRRAMSSAWPVPRATTLTSMPVFCLNSGRMKPYSPESCVEVVEATTMDLFCAEASEMCARAKAKATTNERFRTGKPSLSGPVEYSHTELSCTSIELSVTNRHHIPPNWGRSWIGSRPLVRLNHDKAGYDKSISPRQHAIDLRGVG